MGQRITSVFHRNNENVQEVAITNENSYKWPPKTGNYFGSHFIMGGERFEIQQPESFLFGENNDLNFLGNHPVPFPYPTPQLGEPTRTLRSLVNIRKDTVRLVKCGHSNKEPVTTDTDNSSTDQPHVQSSPDGSVNAEDKPTVDDSKYNLEFVFDSDVTCNITVMYFAKEDIVNGAVVYTPRDTSMNSETYTYKRGANQLFSQTYHVIEPSKFPDQEWAFDFEKKEIPIVIHCTVEKEPEHSGHSHVMFCSLEKLNDCYIIKSIKQKQCVDGVLYILQEFYGIENKEVDVPKVGDNEEVDDNTAECVICMSDIRDTLILPCRHLCLCNGCADSLRYQANNCPICRAPFRALLQLRAIRKKLPKTENEPNTPATEEGENDVSQKGVPAGFEAISLIEALNGPCFYNGKNADPRSQVVASRGSLRHSKKKRKEKQGSKISLKDKDKDAIANEERAKEQENQTTNPVDPVNKTPEPEKDAETEGLSEMTTESLNKDGEVRDAEHAEDKPVQSADGEDSANKATLTKQKSVSSNTDGENTVKIPEVIDRQASVNVEDFADHAADSESDDDMYSLSARTQVSTLPGTPDYVINEVENGENAN